MDELEDLLRRYRPIGVPEELRAAIVRRAHPRFSLLEWAPAAAALILTVLFSWLAANERTIAESHLGPPSPFEQTTLENETSRQ